MDNAKFRNLVKELAALPEETEWVERKFNKAIGGEIGEYLSALANSAALHGKPCGYLLWGVDNESRQLAGTTFRPRKTKVGNEELENWLVTQLDPRIDVRIREGEIDGKHLVLFEVTPAYDRPVRFQDTEFIRIGSYKKKLRDHPEKERALWRLFERVPFELGAARRDADGDEVLTLIDYPGYFHLMRQPLPENRAAILTRLESEKIISREGDRYHVSNVGAILFGRSLGDFERLARKRLRIIIYRNDNRVQTVKEQVREVGYAIGFEETIRYLNDLLPQNEEMGQALRKEVRRYPEIAIRELVANALIHQDFSVTGAGPTVEIFARRLEITNPGTPLIDTLRFIDEPPRSRNEILASLMRRMSICEERGSGIDKVISAVELFQLPAPEFRVSDGSTIAILPGPRSFSQMEQQERIRACYQHACLQYVSGGRMTNASLRKRLGIKDSNYPAASKIIKDTIAANLIKVFDRNGASDKKGASYVPFWT